MLRIVVDTNIWIRALMGGRVSLPILIALQQGKFKVIVSDALLTELKDVVNRPRIQKRIDPHDAEDLLTLLEWYGESVVLKTIPPRCRDPKDHPVLATAIDGQANAIVSGDDDLRTDERLREATSAYNVQLWGVNSLLQAIQEK